jgi:hypothetical protein
MYNIYFFLSNFVLTNMDILDLEMKQRSSKMDTLKEQLRQMEDEQHKSEQERQRELQEQKQNIQTDSTIQDLETMVMRDLSYNVPVEYYENPWRINLHGLGQPPTERKNAIKKTKHTFDIIKEQHVNLLLPSQKRISYEMPEYQKYRKCGYPIPKYVIDTVPNPSIAETSDKFVAILNIVKQQDARIKELEKQIST